MEHLYRFNEEFNWDKLNIFSKKEKEKMEEKDFDDDELANAILDKISPGHGTRGGFGIQCEVTGSYDERSGQLKCEFDGDKFIIHPNGVKINGRSLKCKESICKKFWDGFKNAKKRQDDKEENKKDKEVKDKLKDKYKPESKKPVDNKQVFRGHHG